MKKVNILIKVLLLYVVFVIVLVIGEFIPKELYKENAVDAAKIIVKEGPYPSYLSVVMWDNWTDAFLINSILTDTEESALENALHNNVMIERGKNVNDNTLSVLEKIVDDNSIENDFEVASYSRYWAGFKTILKLLFIFFSLKEIRTLLLMSCIFAFIVVMNSIYNMLGEKCLLSFLISMFGYMYFFNSPCMAFYFDIIISLLFVNMIIRTRKSNSLLVFFYVGALSAYPCYWSFPLITLTYPLIIDIMQMQVNGKIDLKKILAKCFAWMSGLVSTVVIKQLVLFFIDGLNADASKQMALRLGVDLGIIFRLETSLLFIMNEFKYLGVVISWILFVLILVFGTNRKISLEGKYLLSSISILFIVMNVVGNNALRAIFFIAVLSITAFLLAKYYFENRNNSNWILLLIAFFPCAWYFIFLEHSWHYFVHFIYGPSLFTVCYIIVNSSELRFNRLFVQRDI